MESVVDRSSLVLGETTAGEGFLPSSLGRGFADDRFLDHAHHDPYIYLWYSGLGAKVQFRISMRQMEISGFGRCSFFLDAQPFA